MEADYGDWLFRNLGDVMVALASESGLKNSLKMMRAVNPGDRDMLSRWFIRGQELKLMVNQRGDWEAGFMGKRISCSQMWSS